MTRRMNYTRQNRLLSIRIETEAMSGYQNDQVMVWTGRPVLQNIPTSKPNLVKVVGMRNL
jgi:hypothetical protein